MNFTNSITRRQFLKRTISTICGASAVTGCRPGGVTSHGNNQLNIFSWADYLHPQAIPEFERRYGIKVVYDTFASNESLVTRMAAGSVDYDIVVPTNYGVAKLRHLNLLKPIDRERIPNRKYLMNRFTNMSFDPEGKYSVPYTFGTTGIAFNQKAYEDISGKPPGDWDVFWESKMAGRMTLLEDSRETLGLALKRAGHSYNSLSEQEIFSAAQALEQQKKLTMCYTSDQVIVYLASGDSRLSLAYSGDANQARRTNADVRYIIPSNGASVWIDNMCIPQSAPHENNALLWINYILEPEVSAALTNYTYYPTPNSAAQKLVSPDLLADKSLYPTNAVLDRCEEIKEVGDAIFIYDRAWTELKCI